MTTKLTLYHVTGTELAYCFSDKRKACNSRQFWIPRSQIKSVVKFPAEANEYQEWMVEIPDWLAEKKNLI